MGIQLDALNNTVHWHLNRTDRHGIQHLRFRDAVVSLVAEERAGKNVTAQIQIDSNKDLILTVYNQGRSNSFGVHHGKNEFKF